jgi:hypothetical protein
MKFAKIFSKFSKFTLAHIILLLILSSSSCMNMRNFEDDVIIKFSSKPEYLFKDKMDIVRNKVRNRMKTLEMKANGKLIYD